MSGELIVYVTYIGAIRDTSEKCRRVLQWLDNKAIKYTKVDLGLVPEKRKQMAKISGKHTLPQLFVDELYIGGFDEIFDWIEDECLLDALKEAGYTGDNQEENDASDEGSENDDDVLDDL